MKLRGRLFSILMMQFNVYALYVNCKKMITAVNCTDSSIGAIISNFADHSWKCLIWFLRRTKQIFASLEV